MKKFLVVLALVAGIAAPAVAYAQETDPAGVLSNLADALNAGNVEAAVELVADDAVLTFVPDLTGSGPIQGKDQIRAWYEGLVAQNIYVEPSDLKVDGDKVTWSNKVWMDDFEALGIAPVEYTGEGVVQEGKIQSYTEEMTDASLAEFEAAMAALPATGGTPRAAVLLPSLSITGLLLVALGLRRAHGRAR